MAKNRNMIVVDNLFDLVDSKTGNTLNGSDIINSEDTAEFLIKFKVHPVYILFAYSKKQLDSLSPHLKIALFVVLVVYFQQENEVEVVEILKEELERLRLSQKT